jgi:hypothetical protein
LGFGGDIPGSSTCNLGCCSPHVQCAGACANLMTNGNHCGACGNACLETEQCSDGSCLALCPP